MRILAFLIVLLVATVVMIYVAGRSLPVAHVAARSERFDAPRDTVWRIITDVGAYASWRKDITSVDVLPSVNGLPSWREVAGRDRVEYVAQEMVEPERFVVRIATTGLPYGGVWRYELFTDEGGTRLLITEEGEVYNPIFRFMMKYVFGETSTIEKYLAALGRRLAA